MDCRSGCGACCIAPSITAALPGMPEGKPAGVRCVNLSADLRCLLFGKPERPLFCEQFTAEPAVCGETVEQALVLLNELENLTSH